MNVALILSTYNGERYLWEQLDSLFSQTYTNFDIIARDDLSSDSTLKILGNYNVDILYSKENLGAKKSFAEILNYVVLNKNSSYFLFCDQDDIWKEDKVEKTLIKMKELEQRFGDIPLLVHTNLEIVDEELRSIDRSFADFQKINLNKSEFNGLLMQNVITGCTMMINKRLAQKCLPMPSEAIMHDWWIGLVASKFGKIGYIDEATVQYRQHGNNAIGAKSFSIGFVFESIFKKITLDANIAQARGFLEKFQSELNDETLKMLKEFAEIEQKTWWQKRKLLWKYKLLKHGIIRNIGLFLKI